MHEHLVELPRDLGQAQANEIRVKIHCSLAIPIAMDPTGDGALVGDG